jgi:Family of unknown function (DUF6585)
MNQGLPDPRKWNLTATPTPPSQPAWSQPITVGSSLGELPSEHRLLFGPAAVCWCLILLGTLCLAAGGGFFLLYRGQGAAVALREQLGLAPGTALQLSVGLLIGGGVVLTVGLMFYFQVWRVRVTAEGLTWLDRNGEHQCTWDEVTAVYRTELRIGDRKYGDRYTQLRLEIAGGRRLAVNHRLSRYEQLCVAVQSITTERLLARKRAAVYDIGAAFGSVTLTRYGIRVEGKELSWQDFGQYYVENGHVGILPRGARHMQRDVLCIRLATIPNCLVFLILLQEIAKEPTPLMQIYRYFEAVGAC